MARAPDKRIEQAKEMYLQGQKLVEIASQLNLPEGTVRRWKCTHKWENERSDKKSERSPKRKRGAQPGNKNSSGGPPGNKKAEKYGFFSKYLPEETREIFSAIDQADPLDLLWHQIQLAYAAIIRAQRIAYVKDQQDKTIEKIEEKEGKDRAPTAKWAPRPKKVKQTAGCGDEMQRGTAGRPERQTHAAQLSHCLSQGKITRK